MTIGNHPAKPVFMRVSGVLQGRLLILGARAVLAAAAHKHDRLSRWAIALAQRRGYWRAVVAIAAKNARMAWAMLAKGETFKPVA